MPTRGSYEKDKSDNLHRINGIAQETLEERRKILAELAAMPEIKIPKGFPSSVEIIREMRDSR